MSAAAVDGFSLDLDLHVGARHLRLQLETAAEVIAVVGPNGAGKTTLLRAVAGFTAPPGHVAIGGAVLDDARTGIHLPAHERRLGVVFQSHLLFPHLDARDNIAFGLRSRGASTTAARTEAQRWLERVGMAEHARARPNQLSGGQAQRVALARALAPAPVALLLDEPLAALDVGARHEVRSLLRRHLQEVDGPVVLVTHDVLDAATLADRIVVLEEGRITHDGTVAEITSRPRTRWAARLAGLNLWSGSATGTSVRLEGGGQLHVAEPARGEVWVTTAPSAVALYRQPPAGSPRNVWKVTLGAHERVGDRVRVQLGGAPSTTAEVTTAGAASLDLTAGGSAWASVKATEVTVYPK